MENFRGEAGGWMKLKSLKAGLVAREGHSPHLVMRLLEAEGLCIFVQQVGEDEKEFLTLN